MKKYTGIKTVAISIFLFSVALGGCGKKNKSQDPYSPSKDKRESIRVKEIKRTPSSSKCKIIYTKETENVKVDFATNCGEKTSGNKLHMITVFLVGMQKKAAVDAVEIMGLYLGKPYPITIKERKCGRMHGKFFCMLVHKVEIGE